LILHLYYDMRVSAVILATFTAVAIASPLPDPKKPGDIYKRTPEKICAPGRHGGCIIVPDTPTRRAEDLVKPVEDNKREGFAWKKRAEEAKIVKPVEDNKREGFAWKKRAEDAKIVKPVEDNKREGFAWKKRAEDAKIVKPVEDNKREGFAWKKRAEDAKIVKPVEDNKREGFAWKRERGGY
jgi:hypothetical protein